MFEDVDWGKATSHLLGDCPTCGAPLEPHQGEETHPDGNVTTWRALLCSVAGIAHHSPSDTMMYPAHTTADQTLEPN